MKIGKILRTTALASAIAAIAFGSAQSMAADGVAYLAHMSASVTSLLNVKEISAMRFGNFNVTLGASGGTAAAGDASLVLDPKGVRGITNGADHINLLYGLDQGGLDGTGASQRETGSQAPGFFDIDTGGEGGAAQNIYVTFADASGNIVDASGDPTTHGSNHATITNGVDTFNVDQFSFESDDKSNGYTGATPTNPTDANGNHVFGQYVTTSASGKARIRVGATLHTVAGAVYAPGRYSGNYYVMVSY